MEHSKLELRGVNFISRFLAADAGLRVLLRAEGVALADRLRGEAIALAQSRGTEFSPAIPRYHQLAAMVAVLAYDLGSAALACFEADICYYRRFEGTRALVEAYEQFRDACTGSSRA